MPRTGDDSPGRVNVDLFLQCNHGPEILRFWLAPPGFLLSVLLVRLFGQKGTSSGSGGSSPSPFGAELPVSFLPPSISISLAMISVV